MEPKPPAGPFGGPRPGAPGAGRPAVGPGEMGAGNFGFQFDYVSGKVEIDGRVIDNVGLRYKGSGTYMMSQRQTKRSLKIDFDRYDDKLTLNGIKKLSLNSGVMDTTKAREALAYDVFRALEVPAPRTALAEVKLTVPGKFSGELLGAFTIVEQVDKAFLKIHFGSGQGLLLKPEGIRGLPHLGGDIRPYEQMYVPKDRGEEAQWQRLMHFTRLINGAEDAEFRAEIGEVLDLDQFARFIAVNAALASMDGFIGMGHNYYLYLVPKTNKFVFIPWDLDLAFGAFPLVGNPAQLVDLSLEHPHIGQNKLIDRLLAMPEWKAKYREYLKRLSERVFTPEQLGKDVTAIEGALGPLMAREKAAGEARREPPPGPLFGMSPLPLASFIEKRKKSIDDQLAGKSPGYVPTPGGPGMGGPPPGAQLAGPLFIALDANRDGKVTDEELASGMKRLSAEWDADKSGTLDQRELTEGLMRLQARPMGR
jgi:hypothetical protein